MEIEKLKRSYYISKDKHELFIKKPELYKRFQFLVDCKIRIYFTKTDFTNEIINIKKHKQILKNATRENKKKASALLVETQMDFLEKVNAKEISLAV